MLKARRAYRVLAYALFGMAIASISFYMVYVRLLSGHKLTDAESYFLLPGAILIGPFYPGPHSGPEFFPGVVVCNTLAYLAVAFVVPGVIRAMVPGRLRWIELARFAPLFVLWAALAFLRGRACAREWWVVWEGLLITTTAWFVSGGVAAFFAGRGETLNSLNVGGRARWIQLALGVGLVLAWGLAGIALCRARL